MIMLTNNGWVVEWFESHIYGGYLKNHYTNPRPVSCSWHLSLVHSLWEYLQIDDSMLKQFESYTKLWNCNFYNKKLSSEESINFHPGFGRIFLTNGWHIWPQIWNCSCIFASHAWSRLYIYLAKKKVTSKFKGKKKIEC